MSFDQIIKGEVLIKKGDCNNYKITFQNPKDLFLIYQLFSYNNSSENKNRIIKNVSQKRWVNNFQEDNNLHDFTPTTIMQIKDKMYIFVINNVNICNGKMIFNVSSKTINNMTDNIAEDLPICKSVARFDIDSIMKGDEVMVISGKDKGKIGKVIKVSQSVVVNSSKLYRRRSTVTGLGLRRIKHIAALKDTPAVRGMINKVSYLLKVED